MRTLSRISLRSIRATSCPMRQQRVARMKPIARLQRAMAQSGVNKLTRILPAANRSSEPSPDCVPALAPEDEPAARRSHDIKLLGNCYWLDRLGEANPRKEGSSRLRRDMRSIRGVGGSEERLPV